MVGGWCGRSRFKPILRYGKNSLELALIARLKSEMKRNGMKYLACALCASRCEWSECPRHRKRRARWLGAAGSQFGAFFCSNVSVGKARAGSNE